MESYNDTHMAHAHVQLIDTPSLSTKSYTRVHIQFALLCTELQNPVADRQTDTQTNRQTDKQTHRKTDTQTNRLADKQTHRKTDRQTDRQTQYTSTM